VPRLPRQHDAKEYALARCAECHQGGERGVPAVSAAATFTGGQAARVACHPPHAFTRRTTKACASCRRRHPAVARGRAEPARPGRARAAGPHHPRRCRGRDRRRVRDAAERYRHDAIALQLRSLNLLYEGMKERGSIMVVPSAMSDAAGMGTYAGLAALHAQTAAGSGPALPPAGKPGAPR
jgi:hypothetical protein